ncbi:DUF86 domain-containing protein [Alkalihalophilus pseudofirmus]|uniref:DUF86 domain-containing protein n=1 Tax=Alkalihalophilus pseudofirmus TaxID=79885 RepID=A0AAJ2NPG7_ALKPS|nr:DUF86 domain-containing protein [Alkalihalophilus pseudofirmus]MDV2886149.1 DUF86 domain-containing protein [Alkalihalophilus pseudofirmus]
MYFVNREKIENTLTYMDQLLSEFEEDQPLETVKDKLAYERFATVVIESIIDVGNSMIDGFIMRDPGSYEDIVEILFDEKVLQEEEAAALKKVVSLRKPLVTDYTQIKHEDVQAVIQTERKALESFSSHVRRYLVEELGPVSAFLPEQN